MSIEQTAREKLAEITHRAHAATGKSWHWTENLDQRGTYPCPTVCGLDMVLSGEVP